MAETRERLRKIGIYNRHHAAQAGRAVGLPDVYIGYSPQETGRAYRSACWQVIQPGHKTNPSEHWMFGGHKTFLVFGREQKAPQLLAAQEWASDRYGVEEWAKIPGLPGAWFPAEVAKHIARLVKEARNG